MSITKEEALPLSVLESWLANAQKNKCNSHGLMQKSIIAIEFAHADTQKNIY